jgi:FdhE protein
MTAPQTVSSEYDARIRRAERLAGQQSFAAEVLAFYKRIAAFQKELHTRVAAEVGAHANALASVSFNGAALDFTLLLPQFRPFLSLVEQFGPGPLAASAKTLSSLPTDSWIALLQAYWDHAGRSDQQIGAFAQFLPRAFLQPYATFLAARMPTPPPQTSSRLCPLCRARPLLGILRPEGDGAKRSLLCSFCSQEWDFRRILCATCGEEDEKKLPVYVAEQFPHIRVECCDTCKFFLRTIDLTKDGHAIPVVDDLAALPLSLWASEQGYTRLQPNLLAT